MTRNTPAKKRCAICALCLLLSAALLAACAPDASGVSGTAESGLSAAGISGGGASGSLFEGAGFKASGARVPGSGTLESGSPGSGASGKGNSSTGAAGVSGAESVSTQSGAASDASVSETGADSPADGENLCHLPLAPGTGTEFPEADRVLALTGGTVALHLDAREFMPGTDGAIGYTIENTTGQSVYVVFAPRLERWTDGA